MRAEEEFFQAVSTNADVIAIVGTQVYPDDVPKGEVVLPPMVVYERRASAPITTIHDGVPAASKVSISASAWATTRLAAEQLGDALEIAMRTAGITVNRFGHFEPSTQEYAAVIDFEIWELP